MEWATQYLGLLDVALDTLSSGRAQMQHSIAAHSPTAAPATVLPADALATLSRAVTRLREYGSQQHLPRGLLARAAAYRWHGEFAPAWRDLNDAQDIAERGEMKRWLTDCALEAARLYLAQQQQDAAVAELKKAQALIAQTGYHRRDAEAAELAAALAG